jgi:hypothetical protein
LISLVVSAFLGLMGNQAQAGLITVTFTLSGTIIDSETSSSATSFPVPLTLANAALSAAGSIYTITGLSVNSSNPLGLPAGGRPSLRSKVIIVIVGSRMTFHLESQLLRGARDGTRQGSDGRQG